MSRNNIPQGNCDFLSTKWLINVNRSSRSTDCAAENSKPRFMFRDQRGDQPCKIEKIARVSRAILACPCARCASQTTHGHARIARVSRAILACPCVCPTDDFNASLQCMTSMHQRDAGMLLYHYSSSARSKSKAKTSNPVLCPAVQ